MDKLNLNSYGAKEMNRDEKLSSNGGGRIPKIGLGSWKIIRKAFQGIVEDNKNNPYGQ